MLTNPNDPINISFKSLGESANSGLTKREYFAAMAMQGLEASNFSNAEQEFMTEKEIVNRAVRLADGLIEELNEKPTITEPSI